ncbi:MAG: cyclase family protein [Bacilli bacterium]
MTYLDISLPIHPGMMVYKNKPEKQPTIAVQNRLNEGGSYESTITFNVHTGTHLDFPLHMMKNGGTSTGFLPETLICKVRMIDCKMKDAIDADFLKKQQLKRGEFILLKTLSSHSDRFLDAFPYLTADGAGYCVSKQLKGVGIDSLGIERNQPGHETHHALMNAGILILEGLRLAKVKPGVYDMIALPLSIPNMDALPVRALLKVKR